VSWVSPDLAATLSGWWPAGGPHWDALARLEIPRKELGILLVEGKSYPAEMRDEKGSGATNPASREKIARSLEDTRQWLEASAPLEAWLRPYYQTANRLATLYWLRRELGPHGGWLIHLCFLNDPTHVRSTREEWDTAFREAEEHLGLTRPIPNYAHVFLPGVARPGD
jgi:hypothetical protein